MRRIPALLTGTLLSIVLVAGAVVPASAAEPNQIEASTRVQLEGAVVVLAGGDGARARTANGAASTGKVVTPQDDQVLLLTESGAYVELTGDELDDVVSGSTFDGLVSVPADVATQVEESLPDGSGGPVDDVVDGDSALGTTIVEATIELDASLEVVDADITAPVVDNAVTARVHTLDVLVATLPDRPTDVTPSDSEITTIAANLNTYWPSQTAGQVAGVSMSGPVKRLVTANACNPTAMWDIAAAEFGKTYEQYWRYSGSEHLVVISPEWCAGGTGLGTMGSLTNGGAIWAGHKPSLTQQIIAHELGHNLGLGHSNALLCTGTATEGAGCYPNEYWDHYDIMGSGLYTYGPTGNVSNQQLMALNVTHKSALGALSANDLRPVSLPAGAANSTTAVTLQPASALSGLRGIEVTDPVTGAVYFVEYRSGTGIDEGALYATGWWSRLGVGVRILQREWGNTSTVITRPSTGDLRSRPQFFTAGQSFSAYSGGLSVTVTGVGSTAQVSIVLGAHGVPISTAKPTITGDYRAGNVVTASPGLWTPAPVQLAYQWLREGVPIPGATGSTYLLATADVDKRVWVTVVGSRAGSPTTQPIASDPIGPIRAAIDYDPPTVISSSLNKTAFSFADGPAGIVVSARITDAAGVDTAMIIAEHAERGSFGGSMALVSGTSTDGTYKATLTLDQSTAPGEWKMRIAELKDVRGNRAADVALGSIRITDAPPLTAPAPTIIGEAVVGGTLTAATGTWSPAPVALTYQWSRAGKPISGATHATYSPVAADVRRTLSVAVTGKKAGYAWETKFSPPTSPVADAPVSFTAAPTPTISGTPRVGEKLTATAGAWTPAPDSLGHQWNRDGVAISGATATTYSLTAADQSKKITVTVTGTKAGYLTVQKSSPPTAAVAGSPIVPPPVVSRLSGGDRYSTAVEISKKAFSPGVPVVYVATGLAFPDALAAAPAAAAQGGPLLLTAATALPKSVLDEIIRLKPQKIVVVGGTGAVSASVYNQLKTLSPTIRRDAGADRFETSRVIVQNAFPTGSETAFVATAWNFPDALAASAAAGAIGAPVVLVDGKGAAIDAKTKALLSTLKVKKAKVAGGTGVVSSSIEASLKTVLGAANVTRLGGVDRYTTATVINKASFATSDTVYLANGLGFADALAGAALAGKNKAPLYTVYANCVPKLVLADITRLGATKVVLLGGAGVLTATVTKLTSCN
ncbi:MAG: cell wall-binding repeat-containing protein [Mycetocola sp.]